MNKVKMKWESLSESFIALTLREKVMISVAVIILVNFALFKAVVEPNLLQLTNSAKEKKLIVSSFIATTSQVSEIQNALNADPNETIKEEIIILRQKLKEVETELAKVMTDYIAPEKMAVQLTRLLKTSDDVRIVGMKVLPPQQIEANSELDLPVYYRHQFELTIVGEYFPLMEFVKNVTTKYRQFGIKNLSYQVTRHPKASMVLSLVTISDSENVIKL